MCYLLGCGHTGAMQGGGWRLLGVQALGFAAIAGWTVLSSFIMLKIIDFFVPLRMPLEAELLGADVVEHGLGDIEYIKSASSIEEGHSTQDVGHIAGDGNNVLPDMSARRVSVSHQGAYGAKFRRPTADQTAGYILKAFTSSLLGLNQGQPSSSASSSEDTNNDQQSSDTSTQVSHGQMRQRHKSAGKVFSNLFRKRKQTKSLEKAKQFALSKALADIHKVSATMVNGVESTSNHQRRGSVEQTEYGTSYENDYETAYSSGNRFTFTNQAYD